MRNKNKDPYVAEISSIQRLVKEWVNHKSLIIAYDYDNTVFDYHNLGYEFDFVIDLLRESKKYGAKFIVYSCSPVSRYVEMGEYLNSNNAQLGNSLYLILFLAQQQLLLLQKTE